MPLGKTWYRLDEAETKYGIDRRLLLEWVNQGIVRTETGEGGIVRVHGDDLELKLNELPIV